MGSDERTDPSGRDGSEHQGQPGVNRPDVPGASDGEPAVDPDLANEPAQGHLQGQPGVSESSTADPAPAQRHPGPPRGLRALLRRLRGQRP